LPWEQYTKRLLIRDRPSVSGLAFPDERSFVPGGTMQMAVQTILRDIQFPANKPLSERRLPFANGFPFLLPDKQFEACCAQNFSGFLIDLR
jgi:hypothetical protein